MGARSAVQLRPAAVYSRLIAMPPRCTVCSHPRRAQIDAALIAGESLRNIAQRFDGPSAWSIYRHTKQALGDPREAGVVPPIDRR